MRRNPIGLMGAGAGLAAAVAMASAGGMATLAPVSAMTGKPRNMRPEPRPTPPPEPETPERENPWQRPDAGYAMKQLAAEWKKLVNASRATVTFILNDAFRSAGVDPQEFLASLQVIHYAANVESIDALAIGVSCTDEQFSRSIEMHRTNSKNKSMAVIKRARKAWRTQHLLCAQNHVHPASTAPVVAVYDFVLRHVGMTVTEFRESLNPPASRWTRAKVYDEKLGLTDDVILVSDYERKLHYTALMYNLSLPGAVFETTGEVVDNNDPDGNFRMRVRVPMIHDDRTDEQLPWIERDSAVAHSPIEVFPLGAQLHLRVASIKDETGKFDVAIVYTGWAKD